MKAFILKAADHLRYPTTWIGLTGVLTTAGVTIAPDLAGLIGSAGASLASLILFFFSDTDVKPK